VNAGIPPPVSGEKICARLEPRQGALVLCNMDFERASIEAGTPPFIARKAIDRDQDRVAVDLPRPPVHDDVESKTPSAAQRPGALRRPCAAACRGYRAFPRGPAPSG
jgi:hypothetical protein